MTETDIQSAIRLALSEYGIIIRQQSGNFELKDGRRLLCGIKGLSDLLFIGQGFIAFIEVKTAIGKPSPEQLHFIEVIKKLGHRAGVACSVEDALEIIQTVQK
jgi:hypothetical protein